MRLDRRHDEAVLDGAALAPALALCVPHRIHEGRMGGEVPDLEFSHASHVKYVGNRGDLETGPAVDSRCDSTDGGWPARP
ncbi:hypothetical protein Dac01nite_01630 [Demequina activiva]|uniref:Uncharacterized protein n=1 Tax=Demequina activiva TaxID=1582364 RepID=A0A919UII0_9MICO|nr:hypothetical protein Dac01nite_01630 [Demequina activiva]